MRGSVPLLALFGAAKAECLIAPMGLSVDYWAPKDFAADVLAWVDPAVDPAVRFSWQLAGSARGAAQAKYQLQVAAAGSATAPLWDSGMVTSNRTLHVPYGGDTPLEPDRRYSWRVRVADGGGGTSAWSPWQSLATAVLPEHWEAGGAEWINGGSAAKHQLRADFAVPPALHAELEHASLFYAGVGYSLAWLNGERVAPEEALGPWTTWQTRILHRCEDVTAMLRPGANALGVWLGGGQYDSTWTHAWFKGPHGTSPPLGLRLLLRLTLKNGTSTVVARSSPQTWTASESPFTSDDVYKGVAFDARKLKDGFASPGYKPDSGWTPAAPVPNASALFGAMSPHVFTPTRIVSKRHPVRMTTPAPGVYVYWFAENSVGWAQLNNVRLPAGTNLTLAHGEQLAHYEGGKLKSACLVGCEGGRVWYAWGGAVDTYTMRGGPKPETYGALLSYHGFQFVELTGWPTDAPPPTLATISAQVVHADNKRIAQLSFPSGKADLLNKLHDNIVRSLLGNMHSVESDCPTRERVGWTGDSQATAETAVMNLDVSAADPFASSQEASRVALHRCEASTRSGCRITKMRSVPASPAARAGTTTARSPPRSRTASTCRRSIPPGRPPTARSRCFCTSSSGTSP